MFSSAANAPGQAIAWQWVESAMSAEYTNNHYVPQWYQRRFIPADQADRELFYLDLAPGTFTDPRGVKHRRRSVRRQGFRRCFAEDDLYTERFGTVERRDIEKIFFGEVDECGKRAVEFFAQYEHKNLAPHALDEMMLHLSTQKLRTKKGLDWLAHASGAAHHVQTLQNLLELRTVYGAIWAECVWQIAEANSSTTKFIVTDHPVTIYNRAYGPRHQWCRGANDPDIRLVGSHTLFPLDMNRILILTNLAWAQNPYQSPKATRANPGLYRDAMFNFMDVQVKRQLDEREVLEINFILKSRAYRYIGAAAEEWLFPEHSVSKSDWNTFGDGFLLMPDPRPLNTGSTYTMGYSSGSTFSMDDQGRLPWDQSFGGDARDPAKHAALQRFQGEFARKYGSARRGRTFDSPEFDNAELHAYFASLGN